MDSENNRKTIDSKIRPGLRPDVVICAVIVVATLCVYGKIWTHEFIGYDDDKYVTQNRYVSQGLSKESVIWAFRSTHASNWHPLTWLSHMLDVELYGMNAGAHHLTNLLFHIFNSLLLFIVFRKMTAQVWQSGIVALLFALHPLHVESVAWVAERKDVVSTFFWMLTIWSYARFTQRPEMARYLAVVGFFSLGLMAKPMLVTLPFVLLLLDYWPLKRIQGAQPNNHAGKPGPGLPLLRLVYEKIPLFVLAGISCAVTFLAQKKGEALGLLDVHPPMMRLGNAVVSYVKYIQKMFWPDQLAILYPYPKVIVGWQVLAAFMVLGCITFLTVRYRKRLPWLFVGWFWYVGTLVPVIGLVQVGVQALADRYTYIPLIGLFLILTWGAAALIDNWRYKKGALSVITTVVFFVLISSAWAQVSSWKNSIRLFEHALRVTDGNYVIHNNLGFELALQGQKDKALKHYKEALRIKPDFELAHINLGSVLFSQGKHAESFAYYQAVLKARPGFAGVHYNFGVLLLKTDRTDEAVVHFQEALRVKPDYAEAYNSLGAAMVSKGKIPEAMAHFKAALQIKPDLAAAGTNLKNLSAYIRADAKQKINIDFK
jgi:predicted negative regulator of RcsB-dependent stress response